MFDKSYIIKLILAFLYIILPFFIPWFISEFWMSKEKARRFRLNLFPSLVVAMVLASATHDKGESFWTNLLGYFILLYVWFIFGAITAPFVFKHIRCPVCEYNLACPNCAKKSISERDNK